MRWPAAATRLLVLGDLRRTVHARARAHTHTHTNTCLLVLKWPTWDCTHARTHTHTHTHAHTHTRTHARARAHTHTHLFRVHVVVVFGVVEPSTVAQCLNVPGLQIQDARARARALSLCTYFFIFPSLHMGFFQEIVVHFFSCDYIVKVFFFKTSKMA